MILGAIQGLTEFFPVSSSGHLVIFQAIFGLQEPQLAFDIFLHAGTLIAVVVYFAGDIVKLLTTEKKTLLFLMIATVPTFLIGFFFKDLIESLFAAPGLVGVMLMTTGIWLIVATIVGRYLARQGRNRPLGPANALAIGIAQGIAITPGISRSGATIATGIVSGLDRDLAFRFSFLLSLPAVGGACVLKAQKIGSAIMGKDAVYFLAGGITAMLVGLATIGILSKVVKANKLNIFGIYCVIAGAAVIWLLK